MATVPTGMGDVEEGGGVVMIFLMFLWVDFRPLPPMLPWGHEIEWNCGRHEHACTELPDGNLVFCPDMSPEEGRR